MLTLFLSLAATAGCDVDFVYLIPAAVGQLDLLARIEPIDDVLARDELSADERAKLELIVDARRFAGEVIGLNVEDNYTMFFNSHGRPVATNVSASRKDRFEPKLWRFPVVGTVPYLGYFNPAAAMAKRRELERQNFDVFTYEIDAYSGLSFFPNPVLSPMLRRDEYSLVDTVIHELLHSTIWRMNDTSFNESLATFFGRTGAEQYFMTRFPDQPERIDRALRRFEDNDRYFDFMTGLVADMEIFYSSDLSSDHKIAARDGLIRVATSRFDAQIRPLMNEPEAFEWVRDLPANNAFLLGIRRYHLNTDIFAQVFEAVGRDWSLAIAVFAESANRPAPYAYLEDWLQGRAEPAPQPKIAENTLLNAYSGCCEGHAPKAVPVTRRPCEAHLSTTFVAGE